MRVCDLKERQIIFFKGARWVVKDITYTHTTLQRVYPETKTFSNQAIISAKLEG